MSRGTTYKQCGCRDPQTGKPLGRKCPKLRRRGRGWSPHHGTWFYQLELPPTADGKRRSPLRRGGFASQDTAEHQLAHARELLDIATDPATRGKIADLIVITVKQTKTLPNAETVRRKVRTGQDLDRRILLSDWLERWLAGKKRIAATTRARYASDIRLYLKPYLGHIPVEDLRVSQIADMFDEIADYNDVIRDARASDDPTVRATVKWRRPINPPSLRHVRATLRQALNVAIKQERLIDFNPAAVVELPPAARPKPLVWTDERVRAWQTAHRQRLADARARACGKRVNVIDIYIATPRPSPVMVWTPAQARRFLDYATTHPLYPLYRLILVRGLRRGEACGARHDALDLNKASLGVCWQITQLHWAPYQSKPKSDAGERTVALDTETTRVLKTHTARQRRRHLAGGLGAPEFLFTRDDGQPLHPAHVTDQFSWLCYQAGLPPIRLHDGRHCAASLMLAAGVDIKIVQETLGHATSAYTRDTYTSVYPDLAQAAADDTAALLHAPIGTDQ